jgi:hypothetical protein
MRKADYTALALIIRKRLEQNKQYSTPHAAGAIVVLEALAHELSRVLSVDREAFLKACGIA